MLLESVLLLMSDELKPIVYNRLVLLFIVGMIIAWSVSRICLRIRSYFTLSGVSDRIKSTSHMRIGERNEQRT